MKQYVKTPAPYLILWIVLNLLQGTFTELFHDEAFYWVCSQHLDWGFWFHPPFLPFLINLGYSLIPNELGVRLFPIASSALTILGVWHLTRPSDSRLFFTLVFSVFLVHIGGFMAAPDIPLLCLSVWFLVLLRKYLIHDHWLTAGGLGLLVAGIAYTKYHGAVFLFFILLANWKLVARRSFWVIPILAFCLFVPHVFWQWTHDFPTFRYNLIDRRGEDYQWTFISDYVGGQLLALGPFISILLLWAAIRYRAKDGFERTLKWNLWGILGFFLLQSFTQRTEANWTAIVVIPLLYLGYQFIENRPAWRKWSFGLAIPSMLLLLVFRIYLIWNFLPAWVNPRDEFHGWDKWAFDISEIAGERPVVFFNTYRGPSKYMFYARKNVHALNGNSHAGNQYDLFTEAEEELQGKEVLLVGEYLCGGGVSFSPGGKKKLLYAICPDFHSYNRIRIKVSEAPLELSADTTVELTIALKNLGEKEIRFEESSRNVSLYFQVYFGEDVVLEGPAVAELPAKVFKGKEEQSWKATLKTPEKSGSYRFRFCVRVDGILTGRNGNFNRLEVH